MTRHSEFWETRRLQVKKAASTICAWCQKVTHQGDPSRYPSHGICPTCEAKETAKLNQEKANA